MVCLFVHCVLLRLYCFAFATFALSVAFAVLDGMTKKISIEEQMKVEIHFSFLASYHPHQTDIQPLAFRRYRYHYFTQRHLPVIQTSHQPTNQPVNLFTQSRDRLQLWPSISFRKIHENPKVSSKD